MGSTKAPADDWDVHTTTKYSTRNKQKNILKLWMRESVQLSKEDHFSHRLLHGTVWCMQRTLEKIATFPGATACKYSRLTSFTHHKLTDTRTKGVYHPLW